MAKEKIGDVKKKLLEINKAISSLDPAIRSAAFEILAPYYFEEEAEGQGKRRQKAKKDKLIKPSTDTPEGFFTSFDYEKPSDNVVLIAAWLYSQYGVIPITNNEIKDQADNAGLTVPDRSDTTMRNAKRNGKNLFRKRGNGYQLTVHGEKYVKDTYSIRKGAKPVPAENPQ